MVDNNRPLDVMIRIEACCRQNPSNPDAVVVVVPIPPPPPRPSKGLVRVATGPPSGQAVTIVVVVKER